MMCEREERFSSFIAFVISFLIGSDLTLDGMAKSTSRSNNAEMFFTDLKPQSMTILP